MKGVSGYSYGKHGIKLKLNEMKSAITNEVKDLSTT